VSAERGPARRLRILALMHETRVPPADVAGVDPATAEWKTEYDVVSTLRGLGHEVRPLGVGGNLGDIRRAVHEFQPHIAFNLLEEFDTVVGWDTNVVAWLELLRLRYTGCNSRGLLLGRDKALTKKLLTYHRIPVADFVVAPRGRRFRRPKRLRFPLFVKSATLDASAGISQASVVEDDDKLAERVRFVHDNLGTDALVETYVEGRELYVGVLGNDRLRVLPVWELHFENVSEERRRIATERLKWSAAYRQRHGIETGPARDLPPELVTRIGEVCRRVYRNLLLSGCARIDLRLTPEGEVCVIEANPNPQIARDEDFAQSAQAAGIAYPDLLQRIVNLGLGWEPTRLA
jgi:D-alanine-D-alanine ligase